jgi:hypothetical protein
MENPGENFKGQAQAIWDGERADVDKIADGLGKGIDGGIKEAVVAFSVYNFPTSQSCEGHDGEGEEKGGLPYPWVEIYAPEPEGWEDAEGKKKEELKREWTMENLRQQERMLGYLAEFYQGKERDVRRELTFHNIGAFGGFRVQSSGGDTMELLHTPAEKKQKQELYREEMNKFAEFLKDKYFSGQ